jgi:uracil-DNA glycosylase family 4
MQNLDDIAKDIKTCTKCCLSKTRTKAVPGEGNKQAEVIFIGEAPGYYEDVQGRPFVGQAGKLLDNLLKDIGLNREKVYITNIVKCRPPGNRDPQPEEINTCMPYLYEQIKIIKPKVICTLGRFSFAEVMQRKVFISSEHGRPFKTGPQSKIGEGINVFPLYHPAAALHQPKLMDSLEEDFAKLNEFLKSPPPQEEPKKQEITQPKPQEEQEQQAKQMDLF